MNTNTAVEVNTQSVTPEELIQVIQQLAARTPVVDPVADTSTQRTRRRLIVMDPEMVHASLSALHSSNELQAALGRNDADVTAGNAEAMTWSVAIDAARKYINDLAEANDRRMMRVGLTTLQTYYICKQLAKDHKHAQTLTPHIAEMKRLMGRRRHKMQQQPAPQQPIQ